MGVEEFRDEPADLAPGVTDGEFPGGQVITAADRDAAEAGFWDVQKAATMAAVVLANTHIANSLGELGDHESRLRLVTTSSDSLTEADIAERRAYVDQVRSEVFHAERRPGMHEFAEKDAIRDLPGELRRLTGALASAVTVEADGLLSPYEKLYDINPDKFARMEVEEFTEVAKDLTRREWTVRMIEENKSERDAILRELETSVEGGESIDPKVITKYVRRSMLWVESRAAMDDLGENAEAALKTAHDKTLAVTTEIAEMILEATGVVDRRLADSLGELQEFMDAQRPQA